MSRKSPNLVFVFPDQMRGSAMGFAGEEPVRTPNLDRFSEQSLVLPQAAATFPVCSPYRAMLMTGMYPHANGVLGNCNSSTEPFGVELREVDRCWSDILNDRGYSLGYIGKWHLDAPREPYVDCANNKGDVKWNEWCPPNRRHGFGFWYSYGTYDYHNRPMYWRTEAGRGQFHFVDQWGPEHEADMATAYLRNKGGRFRDPDRPFALVVSMNPPHMPYRLVPERYVRLYDGVETDAFCRRGSIPEAGTKWGDYYREHIRNYYAMISGVDEQFGKIVSEVDRLGLGEDTLIVFTSDHGNSLGMHNEQAKPNPFEECMRIPFLIRGPGVIPARSDDLLFSAPDVYPTLMELMGFADDIPETVEGASFARLFAGEDMVRPGSQLYLKVSPARPAEGSRGVRTGRHTMVVSRTDDGSENVALYDRVEDPDQIRNVATDNPSLVQELRGEMEEWLRKTKDPWL